MRTPYGSIDVKVTRLQNGARIAVTGTAAPAGGIVVHAPFPRAPKSARVNGAPTVLRPDGSVLVHALPVTVDFSY
jgi:hypothetical protein